MRNQKNDISRKIRRPLTLGVTEVQARVFGVNEAREYTLMVDTGSTYLGLPADEIEFLGLPQGLGIVRLMTATVVADVSPYFANGELYGQAFSALLVPMQSPAIGYELLQNLRYKVNQATHEIERVPDDVRHPPYQPSWHCLRKKLMPWGSAGAAERLS